MARQTRAKALATAKSSLESRPRKQTRRSSHKSTEVRNTSDISSDELAASDEVLNNSIAANQWPKVVVPLRRDVQGDLVTPSVSSTTSRSSNRSPFDEQDTPFTSAMATPLENTLRRSLRGHPTAESLSAVNKRLSGSMTLSVHQSITTAHLAQIDTDERLARELQEQEYVSHPSILKHARGSAQRNPPRDEGDESQSDISESLLSTRKRRLVLSAPTSQKRQKALASPEISSILTASTTRATRYKRNRAVVVAIPTGKDDVNNRPYETHPAQIKNRKDCGNDSADASFSSYNSESSDLSELSDIDSLSADMRGSEQRSKVQRSYKKIKFRTSKTQSASNRALFRQGGETRADFERRRLEVAHPKLKTLWDDLASVPVIRPQQTPQPNGINRALKSFQLEGVDWMRRMETESQWKGGLLGDEMGMGKTIQAVSLIMSDYPADKPSLVVVPPVALMQWSQEIKAYTDGKLKVLVHHNTDPRVRTLKVKDLLKYDVIMISYSGLESMHRKEVKGWKRDDGLVKENSRIHAIQFHRLILDEAHSIKSRTNQVAKACFALKADHKWCLSGTPVQNRIGEFFSLLRFLEVEPFASYFCKDCECESLHWSQDESGKCVSCQHTGFNHVSLFNQELLNPITSGSIDDRAVAMSKLRLLTDRIMLRRMKRDHTSSMELPPKTVVIHNEFFGPEERDFSRSIMTNTTRTYDTYVARGVTLNNYANIFGLIMQMRQVANHPDLILKKHAHGGQNVLVCCICDEAAEEPIRSQCHHEFCRRCAKDYVQSYVKNGDDPDCPRCHIRLRIDLDQPDIEQDEDIVKKSSIINRIKMDDWHSSSKIEMLISELFQLRSQKRTTKSIVFSQFTSMLQLVEWRLRRAGFSTVMLDGSMSPAQRQNSIDHFMKNVDVEIFLVSLKAGGVALNLTQASRVFIVDPWWNPAAEWQSADRCHRIGQRRSCKITRLCIEDSVESRMVLLQEKKANLINGTVNGDDVALGKLTPEDLQFLFRGT